MATQAVSDELWAEYEDAAWVFAESTAKWFANHLQIMDTEDRIVPLVCNAEQMILLYWVGMQIAAGVPIRIMVLKARRLGISTAVTALLTMWVVTRQNYRAFAAAHDASGTETLWEMGKLFRDSLVGTALDRPTDFSNTKAIVYGKPHRSSYRFQTAGGSQGEGKAGIGRSKQITALHVSERAFVANWPAVSAGVASCLADTPISARFDETTANGATGEFYDAWNRTWSAWQAEPRNLYCTIPLFFSWLPRLDYGRPVPAGYDWGQLDEQELRLKALGATDNQSFWRRAKIADDYSGDAEMFAQEYPATPEEAFRASGSPAFPLSMLEHHEAQIAKALEPELVALRRVRDGRMWDDVSGRLVPTDLEDGTVYPVAADGTEPWFWWVWKRPVAVHDYTVFGDVAEGKLADPKNERSGLDSHAAACLDRRELEYVATGIGRRIDADEYGAELRKLAEWYNMAWASPDATGVGVAALSAFTRGNDVLRPYSRLFQRVKEVDSIHEGAEMALWGLKFTSGNRPHVITAWRAACRKPLLPTGDDRVVVRDRQLLKDERDFIRRPDGKEGHAVGRHDDMLFAHMGAWWLHLTCPRVMFAEVEDIPVERGAAACAPSYAFVGGLDEYAMSREADVCEETV